MKTTPSQLRIERLEHEGTESFSSSPSDFYRATANQDLGTEIVGGFNHASILLERVIEGTDFGIGYNHFSLSLKKGPKDIWLVRLLKPKHEGKIPDMEELNHLLENDSKPNVRITHSPDHPSLLLAYRTTPVGNFALKAVADLPEIDEATTIHAGERSLGIHAVYPRGTLTAALVNPEAEMSQAEEAVRTILTI